MKKLNIGIPKRFKASAPHVYCWCGMFGKWYLMMVRLVTWGWRRCWRGKSWVRTDNQSQSSLHHITAFPPPRSSHLLRPSSNHRKSTLAGPPRPEVQAERDTGAQVGVTRLRLRWGSWDLVMTSSSTSSSSSSRISFGIQTPNWSMGKNYYISLDTLI